MRGGSSVQWFVIRGLLKRVLLNHSHSTSQLSPHTLSSKFMIDLFSPVSVFYS
jgi:hypothetical protein